jgi:hypothetical protein
MKNHKKNKQWDWIIKYETSHSLPKSPLPKAKLTIIRHSHRMLDYDGLVGSMKPVVDALVSCGILVDDSWNVCGKWNVDQRFRSKSEGPLLEILVQARIDKLN